MTVNAKVPTGEKEECLRSAEPQVDICIAFLPTTADKGQKSQEPEGLLQNRGMAVDSTHGRTAALVVST